MEKPWNEKSFVVPPSEIPLSLQAGLSVSAWLVKALTGSQKGDAGNAEVVERSV